MPPTPDPADVLETAIGVLQAAGYETKSIEGRVRATKGNARVLLTVSKQQNSCRVSWTIDRSSPPEIHDNQSVTMSCVGFRPKLEKALGID